MVAYAYKASTQEARQEDHKFKVRLGYVARSVLRKTTRKNIFKT